MAAFATWNTACVFEGHISALMVIVLGLATWSRLLNWRSDSVDGGRMAPSSASVAFPDRTGRSIEGDSSCACCIIGWAKAWASMAGTVKPLAKVMSLLESSSE